MKRYFVLFPFLFTMMFSPFTFAFKIQVAIDLDASGSMQGLIDQTKFMLSRIINDLKNSKKQGQVPVLELALLEHGSGNLKQEDGYLQILSPFVADPDIVNELIFKITADGSEEYTGLAIKTAVEKLNWSTDPGDFRVIFIAGNEPMQQGPVRFQEAIHLAQTKGIIVNTIFAGNVDDQASSEWKEAASLSGGAFANIDSSMTIENIPTVFDAAILKLNEELNKTYIRYGDRGLEGYNRMLGLDANMGGFLVDRSLTKATSFYDSSDWDLVDAYARAKVVIDDQFDNLLIEEMKGMTVEEMIAFLNGKLEDRKLLQKGIQQLSALRNEKVQSILSKDQDSKLASVHQAIMKALSEQLSKAGFTL